MPQNDWYLLVSVAVLGALSSIAFSASYQLVARFANKNVIALGLGCSASGPLVLAMQILLGMKGTSPTLRQHVILYVSIAALVLAGLWATVSLVLRHWDAIEASNMTAAPSERDVIQNTPAGGTTTTEEFSSPLSQPLLLHLAERDDSGSSTEDQPRRRSSEGTLTTPRPRTPLSRRPSIQAAMVYNILEPYEQPYLSTRGEWLRKKLKTLGRVGRRRRNEASPEVPRHQEIATERNGAVNGRVAVVVMDCDHDAAAGHIRGDGGGGFHVALGEVEAKNSENGIVNRSLHTPIAAATATKSTIEEDHDTHEELYLSAEDDNDRANEDEDDEDDDLDEEDGSKEPETTSMLQAIKLIWPALIALGIQSGIALTLFPFFTYMPSSGLLGDELPKVLFFGRIFADLLGRMMPRWGPLYPASIWPVLTVAACKVCMEPLFFLYLKSPEYMHSDVAAVLYVCLMWMASGYVNTAANMHAPHMVPSHLKSIAAGMMAITYQIGHFIGLSLAVVLVWLLYGKIGVH